MKEHKLLKKENGRLLKAVSDLTLDKHILAEAAKDEGRQAKHPVFGPPDWGPNRRSVAGLRAAKKRLVDVSSP